MMSTESIFAGVDDNEMPKGSSDNWGLLTKPKGPQVAEEAKPGGH